MPDAGVLATILLIVGLFLLALELMIPSFGMIGIMSAVCLLISAWCAWQAWWGSSPGYFWTYVGFWVLGIPSVLGGMLFLMQNTKLGDHLVLRGPQQRAGGCVLHREHDRLKSLVGHFGKTTSLLTPGGMVMVNDERFHAESQGMVIDPEQAVKVVGVKGSRLVVAPASADDAAAALAAQRERKTHESDHSLAQTTVADRVGEAGATQPGNAAKAADILDFDIPEG